MVWGGDAEKIRSLRKEGGSFLHPQGNAIALFPFTTHVQSDPDVSVGNFLQVVCRKTLVDALSEQELVECLLDKFTDLDDRIRDSVADVFREVVSATRGSEGASLRLSLGSTMSTDQRKVAQFLASIPSDRGDISDIARSALDSVKKDSNLVERMVYEVVELKDLDMEEKSYFMPNRSLGKLFEQDLKHILSEPKLEKSYLKALLGFYFYMEIIQSCMTLDKRCAGSRDNTAPLYFSLDWEKTGQNRNCYKRGLASANHALEDMFVHAVVLELINLGNPGEAVDYIDLAAAAKESDAEAMRLASSIRALTDSYRESQSSSDYAYIEGLLSPCGNPSAVSDEVSYLFDTVSAVIRNTRDEPRSKYVRSLREFARGDIQLEKNRRKSGYMLNLTEEMLMLLTVVVVGARDSLSLVDLFTGFERRGVFLDDISKDEVVRFFERRSMIDRKSDSGETQYVKRVL